MKNLFLLILLLIVVCKVNAQLILSPNAQYFLTNIESKSNNDSKKRIQTILINDTLRIVPDSSFLSKADSSVKYYNIIKYSQKSEISVSDPKSSLTTLRANIKQGLWFPSIKISAYENLFSSDLKEDNSNSLSILDGGISVLSEMYVDYMAASRVSFSVAAFATDTTKITNVAEKQEAFFSTGGNATLRIAFPLYMFTGIDTSRSNYFCTLLDFKVGGSIPGLNNTIANPSGYIDIGHIFQFNLDGRKNVISLSGSFQNSILFLTNEYATTLGAGLDNFFIYGRASLGIRLDNYQLSVNLPIYTMFSENAVSQKTPSISLNANF